MKKFEENLDKLKKFIDNNDKTPSSESKNKEEKILGCWLLNQKQNCKKKTGL